MISIIDTLSTYDITENTHMYVQISAVPYRITSYGFTQTSQVYIIGI